MVKRFLVAFAILALAMASAGTVPSSHVYMITLTQPVVVHGTQLAAGDYRLTIAGDKITMQTLKGKLTVDVPAKLETTTQKFDDTALRYSGTGLAEIRLGGTKTRIVVTP
jgi:hypothetical protein